MDHAFPRQLFPHFYLDGPPEIKPKHSYGGWGSYERLFAVNSGLDHQSDDGPASTHRFESQRVVSGEEWVSSKPAVTPLLPPCEDAKVSSGDLIDPLDFPEQMQYFYQHHYLDAFPTMGRLLEENFTFENQHRHQEGVTSLHWARGFLKGLNYKRCEYSNFSKKVRRYHHLLSDIVSDVPPALLASLLHEELTTQSDQQQFCSDPTGGALGYIPLHESRDGGDGCLIYPSGAAMDELYFHRVVQTFNDHKPPSFAMEPQPIVFNVNGAIRQLSLGNMEDVGNVAVRSDYFCGVWLLGDNAKPRLTDAIQAKDRFSCVTVSPHVPNELVVANERGAAYLWTVKKGLQKFREEDSNLYFNAKSPWRWCEFSCHPRVMVYADRTGAELTDIRSPDCNHTLFRIGKTPACQTGERVILAKYLGNVHTYHHLINTQFSSYIMDERVPSVPMLKWEHMMESPPMFACSLPAQTPSQTCKVLLGAHRSQELMLLQYTGGREHACQTRGPIQKLLSPKESLSHLNLQLPHLRRLAQKRLNVPATGFAALQNKNKNYISVFQLTETGDIFFQTLKLHSDQTTADDLPEQAVSGEHTIENGENEKLQSNANDDDLSQSDSENEDHTTAEVIDNVDNDALGLNNETRKEPSSHSIGINPTRLGIQNKDPDLQVVWDKWFKPLLKKPKKRCPHFRRIRTNDLKGLTDTNLNELDEDRLTRLRKDLQEVMRKKELLLHGVTYLPHLNVTPVPDPVNPDDWADDVSQRLAVSWDGLWKGWWEEKLGMNRDEKIANLRRRRRREKQARARSRTSLSGSFTSSVSYQESLSGRSTVGSQYLGSDEETQASDTEEWRTRPDIHRKSPVILRRFLNDQPDAEAAAGSPHRRPDRGPVTPQAKSQPVVQLERLNFDTPSVTVAMDSGHHPALLTSTQTQTSQLKKRKEFYLSSLPVSQTPTQNSEADGGFSLSQIGFSSPTPSSNRLSQFRGSSQASQPRKKSRMGF